MVAELVIDTVESIARATAPQLLAGRLLRGCNVHDRATVFVQRLSPGVLSGLRLADAGAEFVGRFIQRFGGLTARSPGGCIPESTRALLQRERELPLVTVYLEAILAVERFVAAAMCRRDGPRFATVVPGDGAVDLVWSAHAAWISRASAAAALTGLLELLPDNQRAVGEGTHTFASAITALHRRALRRQWSPTAAALAVAARQRGLAHELLAGTYLRVGEGVTQLIVSEAALDHAAGGHPDTTDPAALLNLILPPGSPASIPTALIVGDRGAHAVARRLDLLLRTGREGVGLSIQGRTTIQGRPVDSTSLSRHWGLHLLLGDPRVSTAIAALTPRRIVARGLGVDRVSATALLDPVPGSDPGVYWAAAAVSLAATTGTIVIGADNPYLERVLTSIDPVRVIVTARRRRHPLIQRHLVAGGLAVLAGPPRGGTAIRLRHGPRTVARLALSPSDARAGQRPRLGALFTAGLAFGLDAGRHALAPGGSVLAPGRVQP